MVEGAKPKAEITKEPTNIKIGKLQGQYLYGPFEITTKNNADKGINGHAELTIYAEDTSGKNIGGLICDSNGSPKNISENGKYQKFYILFSESDVKNGISRIVAELSCETTWKESFSVTYYATYVPPGATNGIDRDGQGRLLGYQRVSLHKSKSGTEPNTNKVTNNVEWTSSGDLPTVLVLKKIDIDNGKPLKDVKLKIVGNGLEKTLTTHADGMTDLIADVEMGGTYQIYEVYHPIYGFVYDPKKPVTSVTVQSGDSPKIIQIDNKQTYEDLIIEKVSKRHPDKKLKGVKFRIKSDEDKGFDKTYETGSNGKTPVIKDLMIGKTYKIYEVYNPIYGYVYDENKPFDIITIEKGKYNKTAVKIEENEKTYEEIEIEKIDKNNNTKKLPNVKFRVTSDEDKSYDREYVTDAYGKVVIKDLMIGKKYKIYEIENPNYGYVCDPNTPIDIITPKEDYPKDGVIEKHVETNEQVYVKLSGFVWEDMLTGKDSTRDYILNSASDKGFDGISVTLRDTRTGEIAQSYFGASLATTTSELGIYSEINGGEYQLKDIKISDLQYYYVEFAYDGLIYQSVQLVDRRINRAEKSGHPFVQLNASRATDRTDREALDKSFVSIDGNGTNTLHVGNYNIEYEPTQGNVAKYKKSNCIVRATTLDTETSNSGYGADGALNIDDLYEPGYTGEADKPGEEIRYVNLGLYEKPQADLALGQDLQSVRLSINGYNHIYNYGSRASSFDSDTSGSWDVGVKFTNEYKGGYKRAVYKSDVEYQTDDKNKELQVFLTYKIALRNQSSYLSKINNVIEYYDNRYEVVSTGNTLQSDGNSTSGDLSSGDKTDAGNNYSRITINTDITVKPNKTQYLYVQFKLNRETIDGLINNKEALYPTAEINSYTVFYDNGKTVAAIDKDSVPGNAVIGNENTYEDDTDAAPPILLELSNNENEPITRQITGSVFLDDDNKPTIQTGKERLGNGIYDDKDKPIKDVTVELSGLNTPGQGAFTTTTDENGNYEISGFIPGQYIITYTWGGQTYVQDGISNLITVQDYKSTIYQPSRKVNYDDNDNNMNWYKNDADTRYQDAVDNYETRKKIDAEIASVTDSTILQKIENAYNPNVPENNGITINKMDSLTPKMEFDVEYDSSVSEGTKDEVKFIANNVDFGIVKRPMQKIDITKKLSEFKLILANGHVLVDATVDANGKLQGTHDYTTYLSGNGTNKLRGFIKSEIDNELIQGATLEVTYNISIINNSELDYMTENYYKYGTDKTNLVTITPTQIADYLDNKYVYDVNDGNGLKWEKATDDKLSYINSVSNSDLKDATTGKITDRTVLYTEDNNMQEALEPTKSKDIKFTVSKVLTTSLDVTTFDNTAEIINVGKPGNNTNHTGAPIRDFPNYYAERVEVAPSTGENRDYALPIVISVIALAIIATGVIFIRKYNNHGKKLNK